MSSKSSQAYRGTIASYKAVTRNRVQFELKDTPGIFELFIDQSWTLSKGDEVIVAGRQDETGKVICHAYENVSKSVKGWTIPPDPALIVVMGVLSALSLAFVVFFSEVSIFSGSLLLFVIITGSVCAQAIDNRSLIGDEKGLVDKSGVEVTGRQA